MEAGVGDQVHSNVWGEVNTPALSMEAVREDELACARKMTFDSCFLAHTGVVGIAQLKTGYQQEHISLGCAENLDISGLQGAWC